MLHVVTHPLIELKLNKMRDERTSCKDFRTLLDEISSLMTYEVFKDLKLVEGADIMTPTNTAVKSLHLEYEIIVTPILRAGIGMSNGVINMLPTSRIGHIGMYRNEETHEPVEYFFKMPKVDNPLVLLCDPMIATGGSALDAIRALKKRGYTNIRMLALVGAPEGVNKILEAEPDVDIYIAAMDKQLNDKAYIIPGLGDAGDRIFGTI